MKKLSIIVAAVAVAVAASATLPVAAETTTADPFVSTQGAELSPLLVIGGAAGIVAIAASVDGDSSSGTTD